MTLNGLLSDEDLRQREFPVTRKCIYLAHAGVAPLPCRVSDAIRAYALECTQGDQETVAPVRQLHRTRELAARLLNATSEEIALVGPTSLALSFISAGLEFKRGENVLIYLDDYPSNVYPWMALSERGVDVRRLTVRELGCLTAADVIGQLDEQTRLVAIASCHYLTGYRIELNAIGRALRERNILFSVDAIQTLGAFPTTVEYVDFLAADSHKWLLGPCAAGILYVRKGVQERLRPTVFGWNNIRCPDYIALEEMVFRSDARRYEAGTHNLLGLVGLHAAIELLLEIGLDDIETELARKRGWLASALQASGFKVLNSPALPENVSGIVAFYRDGTDMGALHGKLEAAGVITSLRADRDGRKYIRLAPHFYNTDSELERFLQLL